MSEPGKPQGRWRRLPRPVRWLAILTAAFLALLLLLAVGLRLATDRWIRPVVEEQASIAIPGEVSIGGLGISLLGLSVTVDDLAIRPDEPQAKPVIEVGRLFVSVAGLPLLRRHVEVSQIRIEKPVVRIVRAASGELDLLKVLVPETPEAPPPSEPPAASLPIRLDNIDLGAGRIELTDRAKPGAEQLVIELPRSVIENVIVAGEPGEVRSKLELEINTEGASIEVNGDFRREGDLLDVDANVGVANLPLARARVYLPDLGWTELAGELDAKIHYLHQSGKKQVANGSAEVRGFRVGVPNLKDPPLSFESLKIGLDQLDLLGRRIAIGQVALEKPRLFFDPVDRAKLPFLPKGLPASEPTPPSDAPGFAWSLAGLRIDAAQLVPLGAGFIPLGLDVTVGSVASAPHGPTDVKLDLKQGDGTIAVDGKVYAAPLGFTGKIAIDALSLPSLLRLAMSGDGPHVDDGVAKGEITVRLGSLAAGETPAAGGDLHVAGSLTLEKLDAKTDAEGTIDAKVAKLALAFQSLDLPGLLPPPATSAPTPPAGAPSAPSSAAPDTPPPASHWDAPADAGTLRLAATLDVDGVALRTSKGEPLRFDLKRLGLVLSALELPGLLPQPAPAGIVEGDGRLRLAGTLVLDGIATRSGAGGEFAFDLEKLDLGVKQLEIPGLLAAADGRPASDPLRVALDRLRITGPKLQLTRTENGIILPAPPGAEAPAAAGKKEPERKGGAQRKEPEAQKSASPAPALRVELAKFALDGGTLRFVDRTVKPFYQGDVTGLMVSARDIAFPELRARDVSLKLDAPGPAPIWALGAYSPTASWFEFNLDKLPLAPLNPYVRNASGYIVNGGALSLYSKGSVTNGQLYAANWLTLFDPDLSGGGPDAPLEKAVGVPVSMALALLKDPSGNIGLSIPVDYNESGASVRLGSVIGSALKQVLIGALTSPLKLLGAAVDATGKVKDATPQPIGFAPGGVELAEGADERVRALAKLAATRPGMGLRLSGQTSGTDAQFLREAELAEAIESGEGLPEPARGLGQALLRRRLRAALEARLAGKPAELDPEDAEKLEAFLGAMEVGPDKLTDLAHRRVVHVQELLQKEFGLEGGQIKQAAPGPPGGSPEPSVDVAVGS